MKQRKISKTFMDDLLKGCLNPLLEEVKTDDLLDLELRGDSVNIYYRGGSLFKVKEVAANKYSIIFDDGYCLPSQPKLSNPTDAKDAAEKIVWYKRAMDKWFNKNAKYEREFQQVIARENNNTRNISRATDYYIADIEYAGSGDDTNYRFDMIGLKWLSKGSVRKDTKKVSLALIEVKYGDGALSGSAGIEKHLDDFAVFLNNTADITALCDDMSEVFKQKCILGLVDGLQEHQYEVKVSNVNPEIIFIFANHDPDSAKLKNILNSQAVSQKLNQIKAKGIASVKVAVASAMGYGLYVDEMIDLDAFAKIL